MPDKGSRSSGAGPTPGRSTSRASNALSLNFDDDEDFALAAMGISDSYRPSQPAAPQPRPIQSHPSTTAPPPRPSSVAKNYRPRDSFTLRHDGPNGHEGSSTSGATDASSALLSRTSSVSTISASPFASPEDPYEGPSNPSHPYQMYPQNVRLIRTASLATTSTAPISEQSYTGPRGPTHPYMMYPQNTVPEPSISGAHTPTPTASNVGFPGSMDRYQRRLGPDGEDVADLIGPDGHTEQLPPYTRYPDEAYQRKALGLAAPNTGSATPTVEPATPAAGPSAPVASLAATSSAPQPEQAIPGAGGIGRATRNPEFSSTEDLAGATSPLSRQSLRSFSEASQHEVNTAAAPMVNEKPEDGKRGWRQTARKRVWGVIPCWAVGLAVLVLILMGVVVGAVIGTMLGPKIKQDNMDPSASVSYPCDYQPVDTIPPGLPPLITGSYSLPLMLSNTASQCIKNTTQAQAWNCDMVLSQLSVDINQIPSAPATEAYSLSFSYNQSFTMDNFVYTYGMQPPNMENVTLQLVTDLFQDDRGPAWFFESEYEKIVIIPEDLLYPSAPLVKRAGAGPGDGPGGFIEDDFQRKETATKGDKPWICSWDKTVFEAFIYVTQNNSVRPINNNASTSATATISYAMSTAPATPMPTGYIDPNDPYDNDNDSSKVDWLNGGSQRRAALPNALLRAPTPSNDPFGHPTGPRPGMSSSKPPQPNVIKILERRIPAYADTGMCRQYEIKGPGIAATPVLIKGKTVDVYLDETFSGVKARDVINSYLSKRGLGDSSSSTSSSSSNSGNEMSDCGCMWWLN